MTKRFIRDAARPTGGCRCMQCGYPFANGDDVASVDASGDLIHRLCWEDYAADNADVFLTPLN